MIGPIGASGFLKRMVAIDEVILRAPAPPARRGPWRPSPRSPHLGPSRGQAGRLGEGRLHRRRGGAAPPRVTRRAAGYLLTKRAEYPNGPGAPPSPRRPRPPRGRASW